MAMKVIITGASGFIGRRLSELLLAGGHSIVAISRDSGRAQSAMPDSVKVIPWDNAAIREEIRDAGVVINLAGESIAGSRWTRKKRAAILNSRLIAAQKLKDIIVALRPEGITYVQASAIGYYGNAGEDICREEDGPGSGFLAHVCERWESYVPEISKAAERTLTLRIGVVLGRNGGFLDEMLRQSRRGLAGSIGSGKQWLSWIHIDDLVSAMAFLIQHPQARGVYNLVAPAPVRQRAFSQRLARSTGRWLQLPAPALAITALFGNMGRELILNGQNVSSEKLNNEGFAFSFHGVEEALTDLLQERVAPQS